MKNLTSLLLFCHFFLPNASALDHYMSGDTLRVWAYHGLVLRNEPSSTGKKRLTIPYGEKVVVQEKSTEFPFAVTELAGYKIKGFWTKVQYQDSLVGFVFDGYLSNLPVRKIFTNETGDLDIDSINVWLSKKYGRPVKHTVYSPGLQEDSFKFKNGWVYREENDEKGRYYSVVIPEMSLQEAFIIWLAELEVLKEAHHCSNTLFRVTNEGKNKLSIHYHLGLDCSIFFEMNGKSTIIKWYCSC